MFISTNSIYKYFFFFYNIIYFNLTSQYYIVFKSVVWKKGDGRFRNAILGLGVGSNPGPLAPESCVLPCTPLHIHFPFINITI